MTSDGKGSDAVKGIDETQRVEDARVLLSKLREAPDPRNEANGWTPAWSSSVLETVAIKILSRSGAGISDLYQALWTLMEETDASLSQEMAHFVRDITVLCFIEYRKLCDEDTLKWMSLRVNEGCTSAQAYLALNTLPDATIRECQDAILNVLRDTPFSADAENLLSED